MDFPITSKSVEENKTVATTEYLSKKLEVLIDIDNCDMCRQCVNACPKEVIDMPKAEVKKDASWKILAIDPRRCVGCEICESVCSYAHDGVYNSINSRINVVRIEPILNNALSCLKCNEPVCVDSCELGAIHQNPETGLVTVDFDRCDGCATCIDACPYGAITIHSTRNQALICDFCEDTPFDTPQCVEVCPKGAIFIEEISYDKDPDRIQTLEKILKRGFEGEGMLN